MTALSTSSTNDVNNAIPAYEVSTASPNVNTANDLEAMDLKWQLSLLSMRAKRYYHKTGKKMIINANDTARSVQKSRQHQKARKQEKEANIALIESWDNTQAMMEANFELAQRLQTEEQGEITIKERSRLFVELMNKRKKHFAILRAEEKRSKPPTKAQKRNQMSTYLKNMGGYKHNQLKSKSYEEI
ncbi:hypothetical protein Tco_1572083 [Tanacetum coccineum]